MCSNEEFIKKFFSLKFLGLKPKSSFDTFKIDMEISDNFYLYRIVNKIFSTRCCVNLDSGFYAIKVNSNIYTFCLEGFSNTRLDNYLEEYCTVQKIKNKNNLEHVKINT